MIGFYDYTVWLTYISLLSATTGIMISLHNQAHPFLGIFFLLICGLCDAFDGRVARSKKNRTEQEKKYGIQIDSLSDLVAFGVLPACIGNAMIRLLADLPRDVHLYSPKLLNKPYFYVCYAILIFYVLAALIRLAYYNVTEEERQQAENGSRTCYEGLPVTSAALIFPTVLLFQFILPADITPAYFIVMLFTGFAFVSKIKISKPGLLGILVMVAIGAIEFVVLAVNGLGRWIR